jgi:hypothetical protein
MITIFNQTPIIALSHMIGGLCMAVIISGEAVLVEKEGERV